MIITFLYKGAKSLTFFEDIFGSFRNISVAEAYNMQHVGRCKVHDALCGEEIQLGVVT